MLLICSSGSHLIRDRRIKGMERRLEWRMKRSRSFPPIPHIMASAMITSGFSLTAVSNPSAPSAASRIAAQRGRMASRRRPRSPTLSSTISTFMSRPLSYLHIYIISQESLHNKITKKNPLYTMKRWKGGYCCKKLVTASL